LLLSGVQSITFAFYDGSQWREYWDSSAESAGLPLGIRVQIQRNADLDDPNGALPPLLQLVVPVLVTAPTNSAASTGGEQ
jgi:hypothetical protein